MRVCLTTAAFVLALATLGTPAAWADEPVSPDASTSAEPTPDAMPTEPAVESSDASEPATDDPSSGASDPVPQDTPSAEPTAVPEVPTSEEPDGDGTDPTETGTGGGEGGGTATPTAEESAGTEQAPVKEGNLAAATEERDPRAWIGDINCANMTVPVTLDNSRSTEAVIYRVILDAFDEDPISDDAVKVPAGATRIVTLPVTENSEVAVFVGEPRRVDFEPGVMLTYAFLTIDCTDDGPFDAQARIGGVDCTSMTVDVTLDNSRSEGGTTYAVYATTVQGENQDESYFLDQYPATFEVPAGNVRTVPVPVAENSVLDVVVFDEDAAEETDGDEGYLGREVVWVDCAPGDDPRADVGEVNCSNLTAPVTLDNTRSHVGRAIFIVTGATENDENFDGFIPLAAGAVRVVSVPVRNNTDETVVVAGDDGFGLGYNFALESFHVDCVRVLARRAGPQLAATGANGLTLPIAGLTLLAGGGVLSMLGRRHS